MLLTGWSAQLPFTFAFEGSFLLYLLSAGITGACAWFLCGCWDSNMGPHVCPFCCCGRNTLNKSKGRNGLYLLLLPGNGPSREVRAGTQVGPEAEAMKGHCSLAPFQAYVQLACWYTALAQGHLPRTGPSQNNLLQI